jgi:hypothetical protein
MYHSAYSLLHIVHSHDAMLLRSRCHSPHSSIYPWELGIVILFTGVGLFELRSAACDSVSNVYGHKVVEVLELVNEVLRVVFVAFVRYRFVIGRVGVAAVRVWAYVEVLGRFRTLWFGAHLAGTTVLFVVILDEFWELGVATRFSFSVSLGSASNGGNWVFLGI